MQVVYDKYRKAAETSIWQKFSLEFTVLCVHKNLLFINSSNSSYNQ